MGTQKFEPTYKVIKYATGATVGKGGMSFQAALLKASQKSEKTGSVHIAVQEQDENLPITSLDVM